MRRILSHLEVQELTKRKRFSAQRRALDHMGIRYRTRLDGSPVVTWTTMDGRPSGDDYELNLEEVAQ